MKKFILFLIVVFLTNICFAESNLKTPKDTLVTFRNAFEQADLGDDNVIGSVFNCLEVPSKIPEFYRQTYLLSAARRLHEKLEYLNYVEENIVCKTNESEAEITLGFGEKTYTFKLIKDKDNNWKFSSKTLDSPDLIDFYEKQTARLQKLTRKDMAGDTFDVELMSPAEMLKTFKLGMEKCRGFNINDSLKTMNMSGLNPIIHESYGKIIAVNLYRILENNHCFKLSSLSADPLAPSPQIILFKPGIGSIMIEVYEDEEKGLKSWQFTPKTLATVPRLYDSYVSKIFRNKSDKFADDKISKSYISSHFYIDDFIQKHVAFLEKEYLDMNLWKWIFLGILLPIIPLIIFLLKLLLKPIVRFALSLGTHTRHIKLEHAFIYPLIISILAKVLLFALVTIKINPEYFTVYVYLFNFTEIITITWLLIVLADIVGQIIIDKFISKYITDQSVLTVMIIKVAKVIILLVGTMSLAEYLGISSIKIFAALGAFGIALALAGKETVQNVFGTIMLMVERPFKRNDYVVMENIHGTIEHVGFRSTRIRTFEDSIVTVPNAHFIIKALENKGARRYRRYKMDLNLAYDTPPEKIIAFTAAIRKLVEKDPDIRKDVCRVRLYNMAASSLDVMVYIFFITSDRDKEIELHEKFLLAVLRIAQKLNVEFAFPTQTIYTRPDKMPEHVSLGTDKEAEEKGFKVAEEVISANSAKKI